MLRILIGMLMLRLTSAMLILLHAASVSGNPCDGYLEDVDAVSGVVPRIVDGQIRALSIYAEQPFIADRRSLINKARRQAELKGKRAFSEWIEEKVSSGTLQQELMESTERTSSNGITRGSASEITKYSDVISSQTDSILSNVAKLDECVDDKAKVIYVRMGWRPEWSRKGVETTAGSDANASSGVADEITTSEDPGNGRVAAPESEDGITIVAVMVDGKGSTRKAALRDALRQAVSQVFGERFASETVNVETLLSVEAAGDTNGSQAIEANAFVEQTQSSTRGTIDSYKIVDQTDGATGINITVNVKLAKYESGLNENRKNLVILAPRYEARHPVSDPGSITRALQNAIESRLSTAKEFNILDREDVSALKQEMAFIEANGTIKDASRIGVMAGADRVLITSVTHYSPSNSKRTIGERVIRTGELNATVAIKLVNPASGEILISKNVMVRRHLIPGGESMQANVNLLATKVARGILGASHRRVSEITPNRKTASLVDQKSQQVEKRFETLRSKSQNDW